jgi:hypothetical protein
LVSPWKTWEQGFKNGTNREEYSKTSESVATAFRMRFLVFGFVADHNGGITASGELIGASYRDYFAVLHA